MPYLNLMDHPVLLSKDSHPKWETALSLSFSGEARDRLLERLEQTVEQQKELRLDLPQGWTLYFKLKEGDNRLLLAHPEAEAWVGTVLLMEKEMGEFLSRLRGLSPADEGLQFGDMFQLSEFSNLDLKVSIT